MCHLTLAQYVFPHLCEIVSCRRCCLVWRLCTSCTLYVPETVVCILERNASIVGLSRDNRLSFSMSWLKEEIRFLQSNLTRGKKKSPACGGSYEAWQHCGAARLSCDFLSAGLIIWAFNTACSSHSVRLYSYCFMYVGVSVFWEQCGGVTVDMFRCFCLIVLLPLCGKYTF